MFIYLEHLQSILFQLIILQIWNMLTYLEQSKVVDLPVLH